VLDRTNGIIEKESELRHRVTMRVLPDSLKWAWSEKEVKELRIKDIFLAPIPNRKTHFVAEKNPPMSAKGMVYAYFRLERMRPNHLHDWHYYYYMTNFEEVLHVLNGN